jgi:hypothetical protein
MRYLAPLILFLILALQQSALAAVGDIIAQWNFEDGSVIPNGLPGAIPNANILEGGNRFLRMTVSSTDTGPNFATTPPTVRAESLLNTDNRQARNNLVTYNFSIRIPSANPPPANVLWQIFQTDLISNDGWVVAMWTELGDRGFDIKGPSGGGAGQTLHVPAVFDTWQNFSVTVFFDSTNGWARISLNGTVLGTITGRTLIAPSVTANNYTYLDVYGQLNGASNASVHFDNISIVEGDTGTLPPYSVNSISPYSVNSISPSAINLASPPSTVTITGTGFANQGFGLPYVNFYTVPGDVRLLDAAAISGTSTTLVQTFNPALFSAGTYRAKVWLRPSPSTWVLAGSVDFTVTAAPTQPNTVTWSNDRGGSGTATGTTNWTISNIPLQPGVNNITVTATDAQGLSSTDNIAVTY